MRVGCMHEWRSVERSRIGGHSGMRVLVGTDRTVGRAIPHSCTHVLKGAGLSEPGRYYNPGATTWPSHAHATLASHAQCHVGLARIHHGAPAGSRVGAPTRAHDRHGGSLRRCRQVEAGVPCILPYSRLHQPRASAIAAHWATKGVTGKRMWRVKHLCMCTQPWIRVVNIELARCGCAYA
jgi:hypothetical protein